MIQIPGFGPGLSNPQKISGLLQKVRTLQRIQKSTVTDIGKPRNCREKLPRGQKTKR
jgi:hypothetical protein